VAVSLKLKKKEKKKRELFIHNIPTIVCAIALSVISTSMAKIVSYIHTYKHTYIQTQGGG
jgi:hypothetical protein